MLRGYGAFYTVLGNVRDAIKAELQKTNSLPVRTGIVPGAIAWDECGAGQCGLLALSSTRFYLSDTFPLEPATNEFKIAPFLAADLVVQLIRCAPMPQSTNESPSVQALDASAQQILDDAFAVICSTTAALQEMADDDEIIDYLVKPLIFVGPQGGCVGSELVFIVGLNR